MSRNKNKELLRRYYEEVVSTGAVNDVARFVSPDHVEVHDNIRYATGVEGAKEHIEASGRRTPMCASPSNSRLLRVSGL